MRQTPAKEIVASRSQQTSNLRQLSYVNELMQDSRMFGLLLAFRDARSIHPRRMPSEVQGKNAPSSKPRESNSPCDISHGACRASLRLPKEKKYATGVFR